MKKEWILLTVSVAVTFIIAFTLVRWFAPQLLGLPADLQMVRVAKEVPPFFDGIFRPEDYESQEYIIQDPYIMRAKPLYPGFLRMGPNDILGFRNRSVPNIADIITIGDSQTYGNNVLLEQNWPSSLKNSLESSSPVIYNMSVSGWGAAEYFEIFNKALNLQPKVVIVAFYTGNDAIDTFNKVYGDDRWESLRLNPRLRSSDVPNVPQNDEWKVKFNDGIETVFTPNNRQLSNRRNHPAVLVGYEIMGKIAEKMGEIARINRIQLVFTIIPTKELVFKKKIIMENITPREDYLVLVNDEEKNLMALAEKLIGVPGSVYVDLLTPLQSAVIQSQNLYPNSDKDGHPVEDGYNLIGKTIYNDVVKLLPPKLQGGAIAKISLTDDEYRPLLFKNSYFYRFVSQRIAEENGWTQKNIKTAELRDVSKLPYGGAINTIDPTQFGPQAFER